MIKIIKEDIPEFDKVVDECLFGEDKLNLKPFDLERCHKHYEAVRAVSHCVNDNAIGCLQCGCKTQSCNKPSKFQRKPLTLEDVISKTCCIFAEK